MQFGNCHEQFFCTGSASPRLGAERGVSDLRHLLRKKRKERREGLFVLCDQAAHLFLLQQGKGICQQGHPEGARSNVSRHQHQKQPGSFREPLLPVQPVELSVLPYTRVLVKGKKRQCLSVRPGLLVAGGPFAPTKAVVESPPPEMSLQSSRVWGNGNLVHEERFK